jgi:hypothetical protein
VTGTDRAREACGGGKSDQALPEACRGTVAVADAGNGAGGLFGKARALLKVGKRRGGGIEQAEVRRLAASEILRVGETGEGVLGRLARHGDRALRQFGKAGGVEAGRGDGRRAGAIKQPQGDFEGLAMVDILKLTEANRDAARPADPDHRVGGACPGLAGGFD